MSAAFVFASFLNVQELLQVEMYSSEDNASVPFYFWAGGLTHDDLNISTKSIQAHKHLCLADPSELTSEHLWEFRLRHEQNLSSLSLGEMAVLNDFTDFGRQSCFDLQLGSVRQTKIFVDIARTFYAPFAWDCAAFNRSRIKSISCLVVAMPDLDFFWKQCNTYTA